MADLAPGIKSYTTSREVRRSLRSVQKRCTHEMREYALLVASNGAEHMVLRCVACSHNVFVAWDKSIMGRDPSMGANPRIRSKRNEYPQKGSFYASVPWLKARYQAIRMHGRRCQACGETNGRLHVDHIKPRSKYPELELDINNLQVLCEACNLGKSNKFEDDWRSK